MAISSIDCELINGLKAQQPEALERLYDSYGGMMYGLAFHILGNRQEAEDVVQDVFLQLWHRCSYDPERGSLRSFLMLILRSRALDRLRSHNSRLNMAKRSKYLTFPEAEGQSPLDVATSDEMSQLVREALAALPEKQRRALELSYFGGMTQQEIAHSLQVPLGTVKSYFRLSFTKLRHSLRDFMS